MTHKQMLLAQRRNQLMLIAEKQRRQIAQVVDIWREPLAMVDRGIVVLNYLKKHPIWLVGGGVVLLKILGSGNVRKWLSRGFVKWQLMRNIQNRLID